MMMIKSLEILLAISGDVNICLLEIISRIKYQANFDQFVTNVFYLKLYGHVASQRKLVQ